MSSFNYESKILNDVTSYIIIYKKILWIFYYTINMCEIVFFSPNMIVRLL